MHFVTFGRSRARCFLLFPFVSSVCAKLSLPAAHLDPYFWRSDVRMVSVLSSNSSRKSICVFPKMLNFCFKLF